MTDRYVVLGLAPARAAWFRDVAQWSHGAALPLEFLKCVSAAELRARLTSGRPFSAVLVDAGQQGLDRDLVDAARAAGCAVLVVADGRTTRDWAAVGVQALLPFNLSRDELREALAAHAHPVGDVDVDATADDGVAVVPHWRGRVVAVLGPGGTGVSTAAIALAQGLADDVRHGGLVALADLKLHAEQAVLHDARDVVPGVQELVEAHRTGHASLDDVRSLTFRVDERRYHLLLGLRRARFWPTIRPRAFEAAFTSLARAFPVVVCDVDADLEGEDTGGSADVEDRNVMARTAVAAADVVVVVGVPSMKGVHSLVRVVDEVISFGIDAVRVAPVFTRAPRSPRLRAQVAEAVAVLTAHALQSPVFVPDRRVDDALRDGVRLPAAVAEPLVAAYQAVLARTGDRPVRTPDDIVPVRVRRGELGAWSPS